MAQPPKVTFTVHKRLSITREAELMQSFVRVNVDDSDLDTPSPAERRKSIVDHDQREILKHGKKKDKEDSDKEDGKDGGEEKEKAAAKTKGGTDEAAKDVTEEVKKHKVKRRKKRYERNRREELYCDKDRAAAVNMGSKDIKQSLKLKRKLDRSRVLQIPEEAEPGTFLALGNHGMARGDLTIARDFMSKALELNPTEKSALVARSKCYILLGQPEEALKDAETALNVDKHFLKAIFQKAEALYYLGDFEHSLVYYHRGLHIRPEHPDFKLGVAKAQKAIENAIGPSFSFARVMTPQQHHGKTQNQQWDKTTSPKHPASDSGISVCSSPPKSSLRTSPSSRAKSGGRKSRLLRELAPDKDYLDNLMKNPNIRCKYKEDDSAIVKCIEDTVEYLNARQEFWRQQLPYHLK